MNTLEWVLSEGVCGHPVNVPHSGARLQAGENGGGDVDVMRGNNLESARGL